MSAYRINWAAMVDRPLLEELAAAAGLDSVPTLAAVRAALTTILANSGGWPYATTKPARAAQRAFALRLIGEACAQTLGARPTQLPGFEIGDAQNGIRPITLVPRVEVNLADVATLAAVPGLGTAMAQAIVDERLQAGPLRDLSDLIERIDGIGPTRGRRLAPFLGFTPPAVIGSGATGELASDLASLLGQETGATADERFLRVIERVSMHVAGHPHPHTRFHLPRAAKIDSRPDAVTAPRTALLSGKRYYFHVRDAIRAAQERVDVAMFHIALPVEDHPTRHLLDALVEARARDVRVRVLVDRDRPSDPYNSTVINAAAIAFLLDGGVTVRVDTSRKLLHSKFLVIDADHTIIGSHNWSAGSYFGFDDLSVDVESTALARITRQRFQALWALGVRPPR